MTSGRRRCTASARGLLPGALIHACVLDVPRSVPPRELALTCTPTCRTACPLMARRRSLRTERSSTLSTTSTRTRWRHRPSRTAISSRQPRGGSFLASSPGSFLTSSEVPSGNSGLCTAECTSDDDCESVPGSPCTGGFACSVAATVGPFCCRKVCVCRDYGVFPERAACDPDNADNTCRNFPGRSG